MKREIKFRVWNGSQMIDDVTVGKHGAFWTSGIAEQDSASLGNTTIYQETTPLMQFTGLRDKNGKEIYEGDVVKINGTEEFFKIIWLDAGLAAISQTGYCVTIWRFPHTVEVIGNIYGNPELLK